MGKAIFERIKQKKFSGREKLIFSVTITALCLAMIFNFIIVPLLNRINGINEKIGQKEQVLRRYSHLIDQGENVRSLYKEYKGVPGEGNASEEIAAELFKKSEETARKFQLLIQGVKPLPGVTKKGYNQVLLELELIGSFRSIFEFINEMETSVSLVQVSSFWLSAQSNVPGQLRCRIIFSQMFFNN